jgi:hypothetical protein
MNTDNLIAALAADAGPGPLPQRRAWQAALGIGALVTIAAFSVSIGRVRPDIAAAVGDPRVLLKFVFTLGLAASAMALLRAMAMPGADIGARLAWLLAPVVLLAAGVAIDLASLPASSAVERLVGNNSMVCLVDVPLLGIGPLALLLLALRHGAPTRPTAAGFVAGLVAGALAATAYATYCPDDSPLFVASWYTIAIVGLGIGGALAARGFARW